MPNLRMCPTPGQYAIIRTDPVASVQHLNDEEASAAAAAITPKSYLVLLGSVCSTLLDLQCLQLISAVSAGSGTSSAWYALVRVQPVSRGSESSSCRPREGDHSGDVYRHISQSVAPYRTAPGPPRARLPLYQLLSLDGHGDECSCLCTTRRLRRGRGH